MDGQIISARPVRGLPQAVKAILITLSAALLFVANFSFGFSVTVGGRELAGVYSPRSLLNAVESAETAAGEILGKSVSLRSGFEVRPRIVMGVLSSDTLALERSLLEVTPGILKLCAVRVDGELIGWVPEQSELGEMLDSLLGERCGIHTVSAGFTKKITAQYSYASAETRADALEVSRIIREMDIIQVVNAQPELPPEGAAEEIIW